MFEQVSAPKEPQKAKPRSSIERVVGDIKDVQKANIMRTMTERFDDQVYTEMRGKEREKTADELRIIQLANDATNGIRRHFGLSDFDIPARNIHIIREKDWPSPGNGGWYDAKVQAVATKETDSKMVFAETTVHEMLHFKSYNALQAQLGTNLLTRYRSGLTIFDRTKKRKLLNNLDEAMTEELTKRVVVENLFRNPLFAVEMQRTRAIMARLPKEEGDEDVYFAKIGREKGKIDVNRFTYAEERAVLSALVEKIFQSHPGKFADTEEVLEVFAKGMMTGKILEIGRLIDGAFGKGTLRNIAEMDDDVEAQLAYVRGL